MTATTEMCWPLGLIPRTAWGQGGRTGIPPEAWAKVKVAVHAHSGHECEAPGCGERVKLECHEWYVWDDTKGIQRLGRVASACRPHHACVHIGRTRTFSGSDRAARDALSELAKANGLTLPQAAAYCRHELALCAERSRKRWSLDLSPLVEYGVTWPSPTERRGAAWMRRLLGVSR